MHGFIFRGLALCALAWNFSWTIPGNAKTPVLHDGAKLFSKAAEQRATRELKEIARTFKSKVVVESYATAPSTGIKGAPLEKDPVFRKWLEKITTKAGGNSLHVLLVAKPSYLLVSMGELFRERGLFQNRDRSALMQLMASRLRVGKADLALFEGIALLRSTFSNRMTGTQIPTFTEVLIRKTKEAQEQKAAASTSAAPSSYITWIGILVVLIFAAWLTVNVLQTVKTIQRSQSQSKT